MIDLLLTSKLYVIDLIFKVLIDLLKQVKFMIDLAMCPKHYDLLIANNVLTIARDMKCVLMYLSYLGSIWFHNELAYMQYACVLGLFSKVIIVHQHYSVSKSNRSMKIQTRQLWRFKLQRLNIEHET